MENTYTLTLNLNQFDVLKDAVRAHKNLLSIELLGERMSAGEEEDFEVANAVKLADHAEIKRLYKQLKESEFHASYRKVIEQLVELRKAYNKADGLEDNITTLRRVAVCIAENYDKVPQAQAHLARIDAQLDLLQATPKG